MNKIKDILQTLIILIWAFGFPVIGIMSVILGFYNIGNWFYYFSAIGGMLLIIMSMGFWIPVISRCII